MLFFSLAENTNFSAQSHGRAEGTEFTISLFTIMALTFQGNELGGKEHHWVPNDKEARLALLLIIRQGSKALSLEHGEGSVNFGEWARRFGVCVMQSGVWPSQSGLTFTSAPQLSRHFFANYDPKHAEKYPWPLTVCKEEAMPLE